MNMNTTTIATPDTNRLWTVKEVAHYLHCSTRHVNNLIRGGLPCIYVGRLVRFSPDQVKEFVVERARLRAR